MDDVDDEGITDDDEAITSETCMRSRWETATMEGWSIV